MNSKCITISNLYLFSNDNEARKSSEKETVAKSVDDSDITAILAKLHG